MTTSRLVHISPNIVGSPCRTLQCACKMSSKIRPYLGCTAILDHFQSKVMASIPKKASMMATCSCLAIQNRHAFENLTREVALCRDGSKFQTKFTNSRVWSWWKCFDTGSGPCFSTPHQRLVILVWVAAPSFQTSEAHASQLSRLTCMWGKNPLSASDEADCLAAAKKVSVR